MQLLNATIPRLIRFNVQITTNAHITVESVTSTIIGIVISADIDVNTNNVQAQLLE